MPRDFAAAASKHWGGIGLVKATATALGESHLYLGAWHDNLSNGGEVTSRDCGVFQINVPVRDGQPGTQDPPNAEEAALRTPSTDPVVWKPVLANSIEAALKLYNQPWSRDGKPGIRQWQPWYAYTEGWATFPEWWVWHVTPEPPHWFYTGRYIQKALVGVANFHFLIAKDTNAPGALALARQYASLFKVKGTLAVDPAKGVYWEAVPPKPTAPPADGIGPRPKPNDGR